MPAARARIFGAHVLLPRYMGRPRGQAPRSVPASRLLAGAALVGECMRAPPPVARMVAEYADLPPLSEVIALPHGNATRARRELLRNLHRTAARNGPHLPAASVWETHAIESMMGQALPTVPADYAKELSQGAACTGARVFVLSTDGTALVPGFNLDRGLVWFEAHPFPPVTTGRKRPLPDGSVVAEVRRADVFRLEFAAPPRLQTPEELAPWHKQQILLGVMEDSEARPVTLLSSQLVRLSRRQHLDSGGMDVEAGHWEEEFPGCAEPVFLELRLASVFDPFNRSDFPTAWSFDNAPVGDHASVRGESFLWLHRLTLGQLQACVRADPRRTLDLDPREPLARARASIPALIQACAKEPCRVWIGAQDFILTACKPDERLKLHVLDLEGPSGALGGPLVTEFPVTESVSGQASGRSRSRYRMPHGAHIVRLEQAPVGKPPAPDSKTAGTAASGSTPRRKRKYPELPPGGC